MSVLTIRSQQLAMAAVRHRLPSAGTGAAQAGDLSQEQAETGIAAGWAWESLAGIDSQVNAVR